MSENNSFRTISGIIQFPPKDGQAGGKAVRNISVRQTGVHEKESLRVSATVWPSFDHIELEEGMAVMLDGKYSVNTGTNQAGEKVTYHNLSVTKLVVLGTADSGTRPGVENSSTDADEPEPGDDDIPF